MGKLQSHDAEASRKINEYIRSRCGRALFSYLAVENYFKGMLINNSEDEIFKRKEEEERRKKQRDQEKRKKEKKNKAKSSSSGPRSGQVRAPHSTIPFPPLST